MSRMVEEAKIEIASSSSETSIYVGVDSDRYKVNGKWFAKYSTVIIVHKNSKNGAKIFHETIELPDYGNVKQRLLQEVGFAISTVQEIAEVVGERHLEIHLDLNGNPKYKSNTAVKEALGWVRGSTGLDAVIKPDSFAASHAADHIVRNKGNMQFLQKCKEELELTN